MYLPTYQRTCVPTYLPTNEPTYLPTHQDCDNGFSLDFIESVVGYLKQGDLDMFVFWRGDDGGVTGRMGCWSDRFIQLNGYDEDMKGHGSQDIDIKYRFNDSPPYKAERGLVFGKRCNAGWSVNNDEGGNETLGWAAAKMVNVNPEVSQGRTWGQQAGWSWKQTQNKKDPRRNEDKAFEKLGTDFNLWDVQGNLSDVVLSFEHTPRNLTWG